MTGLNSNKLGFYARFRIEEEYFQHNYLQTQPLKVPSEVLSDNKPLAPCSDHAKTIIGGIDILLRSGKSILSEY